MKYLLILLSLSTTFGQSLISQKSDQLGPGYSKTLKIPQYVLQQKYSPSRTYYYFINLGVFELHGYESSAYQHIYNHPIKYSFHPYKVGKAGNTIEAVLRVISDGFNQKGANLFASGQNYIDYDITFKVDTCNGDRINGFVNLFKQDLESVIESFMEFQTEDYRNCELKLTKFYSPIFNEEIRYAHLKKLQLHQAKFSLLSSGNIVFTTKSDRQLKWGAMGRRTGTTYFGNTSLDFSLNLAAPKFTKSLDSIRSKMNRLVTLIKGYGESILYGDGEEEAFFLAKENLSQSIKEIAKLIQEVNTDYPNIPLMDKIIFYRNINGAYRYVKYIEAKVAKKPGFLDQSISSNLN